MSANKNRNFDLKYINILGFKSLVHVHVAVADQMSLLIGPNGSGKTSILQAVDFVYYFVRGEPDQFFDHRRWEVNEIRTSGKSRTLRAAFVFRDSITDYEIFWGFSWNTVDRETIGEEVIILDQESGHLLGENAKRILSYQRKSRSITIHGRDGIKGVRIAGSALAVADVDENRSVEERILNDLRIWANGLLSLELLDPKAMRYGTRGSRTHIGRRGEHVASFLASLDEKRYQRVMERLRRFYPATQGLRIIRKRAGWIDLKLDEKYSEVPDMTLQHVSDGFLRILSLACIPEFDADVSLVLLDEIEDGLDPHIISSVVDELRSKNSGPQIIATSHSPIVINYFSSDEVNLVAKDENGFTITAFMAAIDQITEYLDFEGPGEIWMNTVPEKLQEWVREHQDEALQQKVKEFLER